MLRKIFLFAIFLACPTLSFSQKAYFVDGFHGGIWGHYPLGYTSYIVEQLNKNQNWNINLEIEPETWARDVQMDSAGFQALKAIMSDQSVNGRIEYVNPTYAQPYMYNISGESIIRQFAYGINTLKKHFSNLNFKTYSSEEPCFTSALPQILKSFGYQFASLKNPNTGWGGYTRAHGKELVNWIGPDGSAILASPRYAVEALTPNSTWETTGNDNNQGFIKAAFADGILNPVGMTLQDAGWRQGPWLKGDFYKPSIYTTWRNYFENVADVKAATDWKFNQEDVLTSLVWGSQVLQQLAQQTRASENKIVQAEKIAVINKLDHGAVYPASAIDGAWRTLMLAQHHDCWIVPYNGEKGDTWADKVLDWTNHTNAIADSIKHLSNEALNKPISYLKVYNTLGTAREEWIKAEIPADFSSADQLVIMDQFNKTLPTQLLKKDGVIIFKARVPAFGFAAFTVRKGKAIANNQGAKIVFNKNGDCILETDLYRIYIDKAKGGTVKSLVAKTLGAKEFVKAGGEHRFNELRGNFYKKGGFHSNTDIPASIKILEEGPYQISIEIESEIAGNAVSQVISLSQGQQLIDFKLTIDWKLNEGIGEFEETNYQSRALHKAFYDDRFKLLTLFPLALNNQKVFKDAPFDVTESRLKNTFFNSWDSIKNNIVLNWVDVVDGAEKYGMTLFTDHTSSYTHGEDFPLGLTTQYSGYGLWGRDYSITKATQMKYQLLPHRGNWRQAGTTGQLDRIKEPLQVSYTSVKPLVFNKSFIASSNPVLSISSCTYRGDDLYVRVFNNAKTPSIGNINIQFPAKQATVVELDGTVVKNAKLKSLGTTVKLIPLEMKPFGITTIKISK